MEEDEQSAPRTSGEGALRSMSLVPNEDAASAAAPRFRVVATENALERAQNARYVSIGCRLGGRAEYSATLLDAEGHDLPTKYRAYQVDDPEASPAPVLDLHDYLRDATLSAFALTREEIGEIENATFNLEMAQAQEHRFACEISETVETIYASLSAQIQRMIDEDPVIQETLDIVAETNRILAEMNAALEVQRLPLVLIDPASLIQDIDETGKVTWDGLSTAIATTQSSSSSMLTIEDVMASVEHLRTYEQPSYVIVAPAYLEWLNGKRPFPFKETQAFLKQRSRELRIERMRKRIRRKRRAIARRRRKGVA